MNYFSWSIIVIVILSISLFFILKFDNHYNNVIAVEKQKMSIILLSGLYSTVNVIALVYLVLFLMGSMFMVNYPFEIYVNSESISSYHTSSSLATWDGSKNINDACLESYGKNSDELINSSIASGEGYYDYMKVTKLDKKIYFQDFLIALTNLDTISMHNYSVEVVKQTESITISGELKKVISDKIITYHIGDYVFSEKQSNELDGYFGKNVSLSIVYNKNTMNNSNQISDYIIISAAEINE